MHTFMLIYDLYCMPDFSCYSQYIIYYSLFGHTTNRKGTLSCFEVNSTGINIYHTETCPNLCEAGLWVCWS